MRYFEGSLRLYIGLVLSFAFLVVFSGIAFAEGPYGHDFGRLFAEGDIIVDVGGGPYRADFGRLFSAGDPVIDVIGGPYQSDFGRLFAKEAMKVEVAGGPYRADFRF